MFRTFVLIASLLPALSGCSDALHEEAAAPAYRWDPDARSFFEEYCVSCHGPGHSGGDYTRYEHVAEDAVGMRCGLASVELEGCGPSSPPPRSFPTGPRPPEDEVQQVVEWLENDLPR